MITVFTPAYNRAYIIDNLYKSLLKQTSFDFEWLVVDDGSTDDTKEYFAKIMRNDNPFEIRYFYQENGGKHRTINKGVSLAKGELFFIVDSDDYLMPNAIEKLIAWQATLDTKKKFAGVSGLRGYNETKVVGGAGKGKSDYIDAKNTERKKYKLLGDKAEAYFTDVLKKYPFPEFEGEKFITEEVVWNAVAADGYYIRWFNDVIYICDYLDDGLTKSGNSIFKNSPQGTLYWTKQKIKIFHNPIVRLRAIYSYYTIVNDVKTKKEIATDLGVSRCKLNLAILLANVKHFIKHKH